MPFRNWFNAMLTRINGLSTAQKVAIVIGGYVLAFIAAFAAVKIYIWSTGYIDRVGAGGMTAFGDSFFFLAVFCVASLPATGAALFFLRGYRPLWTVLSVIAIAVAVTGLAALFAMYVPYGAPRPPWFRMWEMFSPLRILSAPLFGMLFFVAGLFSPAPRPRLTLFLATLSEAAVFALTLIRWFGPSFFR
jgi:hypothetical protein